MLNDLYMIFIDSYNSYPLFGAKKLLYLVRHTSTDIEEKTKMYEISPRHAAGIRKNYFDDQRKISPKIMAQVKSLMSYSGYQFKTSRDFVAYYKNIGKKLQEVSLYSVASRFTNDDPSIYSLNCIATPLSKTVVHKSNGQSYVEEYLKLQYIQLYSHAFNGLSFQFYFYPQHAEITSHAIERIIQRLKTTQCDKITEEIRSSVLSMTNMFNALMHYPITRWPRRMAIPTRSGAFLVEIDSRTQTFLYRTFVKDEMYDFQEKSITTIRNWLRTITQAKGVTSQLAAELLTHKNNKWWWDPNKDQKYTMPDNDSVS